MKSPGPDHPITIERNAKRVRVMLGGEAVADSARALRLHEASYKPVFYIPRADARMDLLERSDHRSHCPYKGDASYYSIRVGERVAKDAVWSYEQPFPAVAQIAGHLAFYPDRVEAIEVSAKRLTRIRRGTSVSLIVTSDILSVVIPGRALARARNL